MGADEILQLINVTVSLPLLIVIVVWFVRYFFPIKNNKLIILIVFVLSFIVGILYKFLYLDGDNSLRELARSGVNGFVFAFEAMGLWGMIKGIWPKAKAVKALKDREKEMGE